MRARKARLSPFARMISLSGIMLLASMVPNLCRAEELISESYSDADLTTNTVLLGYQPGFGLIRLRIDGPGEPDKWELVLDYGDERTLTLDPASLATRIVGRSDQRLTIDVPLVSYGKLSVRAPAGVRVRIERVIRTSPISSEQTLRNSTVLAYNQAISVQEREYSHSFGRLEPLAGKDSVVGTCTAFRVAKGYWATAAHCVYRDRGSKKPMTKWRLQLLSDNPRLPAAPAYFDAVPVASGVQRPSPGPETILTLVDIDYAILEVANDPGGPSFQLTKKKIAGPKTSLELLQFWAGKPAPPEAGLAKAKDGGCQVLIREGEYSIDASYCPRMIQHGCSSEEGGSGGALLNRASFELEGVHFSSGQVDAFNCAVPVGTIVQDLCSRHPSIAGKVATCT